MTTSFKIGQRPVVTATFADIPGGAGVVTEVTFMVRTPAGVETSTSSPDAAITNPESNVWVFVMPTITVAGSYLVRAKTTSGLVAASEIDVPVQQSGFATP